MSGDLGEVEPLQEVLAVGQVLTLLVDLAEEEVQDVLGVALLISLDVVGIYLIPGEKILGISSLITEINIEYLTELFIPYLKGLSDPWGEKNSLYCLCLFKLSI